MHFSPKNYADFLAMVKKMAGIEAVFYFDGSLHGDPSTFRIWAILGEERVCLVSNVVSKPGSFDVDFPDAVALSNSDSGISV